MDSRKLVMENTEFFGKQFFESKSMDFLVNIVSQ